MLKLKPKPFTLSKTLEFNLMSEFNFLLKILFTHIKQLFVYSFVAT